MNTVIIASGISMSGKTRYAADLINAHPNFVEINRDNIRKAVFKIQGWSEYNHTIENEKIVTHHQFEAFKKAIDEGKDIIITDTNIRMKYIRGHVRYFKKFGYNVKIKFFDLDIMTAILRNSNRVIPIDMEFLKTRIDLYNSTKKMIENSEYCHHVISDYSPKSFSNAS